MSTIIFGVLRHPSLDHTTITPFLKQQLRFSELKSVRQCPTASKRQNGTQGQFSVSPCGLRALSWPGPQLLYLCSNKQNAGDLKAGDTKMATLPDLV